jgi:hypothetical protein
MKIFFIASAFLLPICLKAQQYNFNAIPDSLIRNANAVKRYEEFVLEIKAPGKVISHERHVYTILNESANGLATYRSFYDKFITTDYLSGILYDAKGKELKHDKKSDMQDFSYNGYDLKSDTRYKRSSLYCRNYPYTVDFEEDQTKDGVLYFSDWVPAESKTMSVQYSKYVIIAPKNYDVRYKQMNFNLLPVITQKGDKKTYTWEVRNIPSATIEDLSPSITELTAYMMLAPSDFEADGYKGNMTSWENYGRFIYQLLKGRDILPVDVKGKVHELTDHVKEPKEKIKILYEYLQKNTHYISIQLGIGGWQPFDANFVATKKYGDCKALSNYMVALLKEAGIIGKYVEIRAFKNARPIVTDFPESQFNHVICCVPLKKDTVWLECTSQSLPAGYLSGFTADRWGLLIDESGGKLVRTPKYGYKDNLQMRNTIATIDNDGNLVANVQTRYKGMQQDELEMVINEYSNDQVLEYLKTTIDLPTFEIKNFRFDQQKVDVPYINSSIEMLATNYGQVSGKRLFLNPNIISRSEKKLLADKTRKNDVEINDEYTKTDTVEITIPPGYKIESGFPGFNIQSKFGKYNATVNLVADKILYIRNEVHYGGGFSASNFTGLAEYYEKIYKADHTKLVLVKEN